MNHTRMISLPVAAVLLAAVALLGVGLLQFAA